MEANQDERVDSPKTKLRAYTLSDAHLSQCNFTLVEARFHRRRSQECEPAPCRSMEHSLDGFANNWNFLRRENGVSCSL